MVSVETVFCPIFALRIEGNTRTRCVGELQSSTNAKTYGGYRNHYNKCVFEISMFQQPSLGNQKATIFFHLTLLFPHQMFRHSDGVITLITS